MYRHQLCRVSREEELGIWLLTIIELHCGVIGQHMQHSPAHKRAGCSNGPLCGTWLPLLDVCSLPDRYMHQQPAPCSAQTHCQTALVTELCAGLCMRLILTQK